MMPSPPFETPLTWTRDRRKRTKQFYPSRSGAIQVGGGMRIRSATAVVEQIRVRGLKNFASAGDARCRCDTDCNARLQINARPGIIGLPPPAARTHQDNHSIRVVSCRSPSARPCWRSSCMCGRLAATVVAVLCSLTLTVPAEAQFTTDCLRPIAIPDTWIENQGSTTTFDATGTNPDVYDPKGGYQPSTDDGRLLVITLQYPASSPNSNGSLPVRLGYGGAVDFRDFIAGCVGVPYDVGDLIPVETGILSGPTAMGIDDLVAQDPSATWDSSTKTVVGSAFARSPRIIQLPVFDPAEYITALQSGLHQIRVVKIVGFFVESRSPGATVHGYLTARGRLTATSSIASAGQTASLSARIEMPAGPVGGVPIQFEFLGQPAGVATTNDADTQVIIDLPTAGIASGTYPGAVVAKLGDPAGFLLADASTADFALTSGIQDPQVTWRAPNPLTYGTPLGPSQLKATAAVPGQFFYTPPAGTVVHAGMHNLTVTFVPDDNQQYAQATATVVVNVTPALLTVRVLPASKLYLDPLPPFLFSVDGFVNGDTLRLLSGAAAFQTAASASSPIGTYEA